MSWFDEVRKNTLRHLVYETALENRQRLTEENARKQLATLFGIFQKELEEAIKENEEMLEKILRDMVG